MALERDRLEDQPAGLVGHEFDPVRSIRRVNRRRANSEIHRTAGVRRNDQLVTALRDNGVLDAVLVAGHTGLDEAGRSGWRVGVDQPAFVGLVIVHVDDDELARLRQPDANVKTDIGLLEHQDVFCRRCADAVSPDRHRSVVLVEPHVEHRGVVTRPYDGAARVGDFVGEIPARRHVPNPDRVQFRALVVDAIGEQFVIRAVRDRAERPVGLGFGLSVTVEQDGFRSPATGPPADAWVLPAGNGGRVVVPRAIGRGHRTVVLLDACLHLLEQRFLQRIGAGHGGLHIGVFGLEIGADIRVEQLRAAHDVLPVGSAQPGVVVGQRDAMMRDCDRLLGGARRRKRRFGLRRGHESSCSSDILL